MSNIKVIRPQKGPQEKFLSTTADIAIYGGAAGGDRKSTRLNSSHSGQSRMPSSA